MCIRLRYQKPFQFYYIIVKSIKIQIKQNNNICIIDTNLIELLKHLLGIDYQNLNVRLWLKCKMYLVPDALRLCIKSKKIIEYIGKLKCSYFAVFKFKYYTLTFLLCSSYFFYNDAVHKKKIGRIFKKSKFLIKFCNLIVKKKVICAFRRSKLI